MKGIVWFYLDHISTTVYLKSVNWKGKFNGCMCCFQEYSVASKCTLPENLGTSKRQHCLPRPFSGMLCVDCCFHFSFVFKGNFS